MREVIIDKNFETGTTDLFFAELVSQIEHIWLKSPIAVILVQEIRSEVILSETLMWFDSQTENMAALQFQIDDCVVIERRLVDFLVEVQVQVSLNVRLTSFSVEVAFN